ncbi:hypothetical protein [Aquimarina sp. I32.4]|uniref:hypothetical protein n=1 Tax=Aquimarina sp. I32.4 TaxID=2053903 RepID=UPI000CDEC1C3|nr:hypothetical protein [Aquimarina sp. I32.4]
MGFKFLSSKYTTEFKATGLSDKEYLVIALDTVDKLKWELDSYNFSDYVVEAFTNSSLFSWGEKVIISINKGTIDIESKCKEWQIIEYGKNKKNATRFISTFNTIKEELSTAEMKTKLGHLDNIIKSAIIIDEKNRLENTEYRSNHIDTQ